jgi:hypothetical protein
MPDRADWERVGEMLQRQRVQLDPRYRNRALFSTERRINYRLCLDIETGARENYGIATLAHIELAYGWRPGSIAAALLGGRPAPDGNPDGQPQIVPACRYEREIMAEESIPPDLKFMIIRGHRSKGHTSWCDPGPARSGAAAGTLRASGD